MASIKLMEVTKNIKPKVAVVSLNFSPGHISHLKAYQLLFTSLGCKTSIFLADGYREFVGENPSIKYTDDYKSIVRSQPDVVFMYNISIDNIKLAKECRRKGINSIYVLHEPMGGWKELAKEGKAIVRAIGALVVNREICKNVSKVLLASETGKQNYERYMRSCNGNYSVFPLIFQDEYDDQKTYERKYFSYIGGFTAANGSNEYLKFVEYALEKNEDIKFLIATKNEIDGVLEGEPFKTAIAKGRLSVQSGRPMTTEEINSFYRQSICVWNAYNRSTQSGVLPNALMQATPVIVNRNGAAKEVIEDREAGCYISMPPKNEEVLESYRYIWQHIQKMEDAARKVFLEKYCYTSQLELAETTILSLQNQCESSREDLA